MIKNNWYIIRNFSFNNIEDHINLFRILLSKGLTILFRKDNLDFTDVPNELKNEIVEDNFENYLSGNLYLDVETEREIEDLIWRIINDRFNNSEDNTQFFCERSISIDKFLKTYNIDTAALQEIKAVITNAVISCNDKNALFAKENFRFKQVGSISFRNYISTGSLENSENQYSWYIMDNFDDIKNVIEDNRLYNAIITNDRNDFSNHLYYINFVENEEFILAINDNTGNLAQFLQDQVLKVYDGRYVLEPYDKSDL